MTKKAKQVASSFEKELEAYKTTSAKIRFLDSKRLSRVSIAKTLNIRYQHVRNVLEMPITKPKEEIKN